jgi:hypothetical protein
MSAVARGVADAERAFDLQVQRLVELGYADAATLDPAAFAEQLAPLRARLREVAKGTADGIPFAVVVKNGPSGDRALPRLEINGRRGTSMLASGELAQFQPIKDVDVPAGPAYLLVDVDTGRETLNVTPDDALGAIREAGRSPLTIEEGIALIAQDATILRSQNCFSLLGSRSGDRRVMALWVSNGAPKLGWCWAGNPHTWLGSASCRTRIGM